MTKQVSLYTVVSATKLLPNLHEIRYKQVSFIYMLLLFVLHHTLTIYRPVGLLALLPVLAELITGYAEDRDCQLTTYEYGVLSCDAIYWLIQAKWA